MKRAILGILLLMVILFGTQQASYAITLNYLSGGVSAWTNIEDSYHHQYGQNSAKASGALSGVGVAGASASAGATSSGGYYVSLAVNMSSSIDGYYVGAHAFTADQTENEGFILLQVAASPGDTGNSGQIGYGFSNNLNVGVPNWEYSNGYFPLVITINGVAVVNEYFGGNGLLNVNVDDIIGIACHTLADNLTDFGYPVSGFMSADFDVSLTPINPVPLPPAVLLFGSGLLGLAGWRRFKKYPG